MTVVLEQSYRASILGKFDYHRVWDSLMTVNLEQICINFGTICDLGSTEDFTMEILSF